MRTLPFTLCRPVACGRAALALALAGAACGAVAAGFQINESSASGLGAAYAGAAALAEDASTLWSNPAGLSRLQGRQALGVLHLISPSIKFSNEASAAAAGQPLGSNGGDAGNLKAVPNLYLALPLGPTLNAGVGVSAPWGLVTEYDDTFIGRFQATRSSIKTINVNPAIAWKVSPSTALGLGLNYQRIDAEFNNRVNYAGALLGAAAANGVLPGSATFSALAQATSGLESQASVKGNDSAFGWNLGVLWDLAPSMRLGAHYRSRVKYTVDGDVHFTNPALPTIPSPALAATASALAAGVNKAVLFDSRVTAAVTLPSIVNLTWVGSLGSQWQLMADLQWTEWSTVQNLRFERAGGALLQDTPENFRDAWKVAVGTAFRPGGAWSLRGGLAWDQTPVRDAFRTPRLPDADRLWFTVGGHYASTGPFRFDWGLAYIHNRGAHIDKSGDPANAGAYGRLNGRYRNASVIASGQVGYRF